MAKRAKVLIVDDERSIRELLEIFLKKEGFEYATASSGEEGLAKSQTAEFDLIISDIKMTDMSGIDLLREVRAKGFTGQFILLTAFASTETAIQALKMGAFDYILKNRASTGSVAPMSVVGAARAIPTSRTRSPR